MKPTTAQTTIEEALASIFQGIERLREAFPSRRFTIDGRLVGDIGEVIAQLEYELTLDRVSMPDHDARMRNGRRVQIKATFKDSLTFTTCPEYYLGFKLHRDGRSEEVFNGPGKLIQEKFSYRKNIGERQISIPITGLRALSHQVDVADRVPRRRV